MNTTTKRTNLLYKIFFVGLILQFFAHTFVTFRLGIDHVAMGVLWSWKEILVVLGGAVSLYYIIVQKRRTRKDIVRYMLVLYIVLLVYALIDTLAKGIGIVWFLKAWKYDFIGFMIFFIGYFTATKIPVLSAEKFVHRSTKIIKALLIWGILWYCILLLKPGVLKLFGYDRLSIEGEVGQRPPAIYRTREFEGLPRNQFVFERPISRGFFLTAFFPLFFVQYLQRRSLKKTRFWWIMYGLNVILTYSRAAWGSWVIELGILGFLSYRKHIGVFLKKVLLPALFVLLAIARVAKDHVIHREFSNTGHIVLLKKGWDYFSANWLFGMGAGSVGPASHWLGGLAFNPENQFLQIAIEFGIIGFIMRIWIYGWFHVIGLQAIKRQWKSKEISKYTRYMIAMSIGILGLSISGMVLHSFTDRMIVYPFMLVFGIIYYLYRHGQQEKGGR